MVDVATWRLSASGRRLEVRFNRNTGGAGDFLTRMVYGDLVVQGYELGSTKAGVELWRPKWRVVPNGVPDQALGPTTGCQGLVRFASMAVGQGRYESVGTVFGYRAGHPEEDRALGPPFSPAEVYRGVLSSLC